MFRPVIALKNIGLKGAIAPRVFSSVQTQDIPLRYGVQAEKFGHKLSEPVQRVLSLDNASRSEVTQVRVGQAIKAFQIRPDDTGSTPCQIASLAVQIQSLQTHLKKHKKDNSSKRGLEAMMTKQRKLLLYLKRKDFDMYRTTINALNLVAV